MKHGTATREIGHWLLAGVLAATFAAAPAHAATNIFLKLDGIPGESTNSRHKDEIDIASYSLGLTNAAVASSTGAAASAGKLSCGDLVLAKNLDKSTPPLIAALASGKHIKSGTLTFTTVGAPGGADYYILTLTDLLVTALQQSQTAGAARVSEQVSFSVAKYKFEYHERTGKIGPPLTTEVDCRRVGP